MTYQILGQWTRCFTEIPGLQQAHEISYSAGWSDSGMQIRITLSMQGMRRGRILQCYEMTTCRAMELAKYLYENGIEPDSALDILADFQVLYREYETFIAAS